MKYTCFSCAAEYDTDQQPIVNVSPPHLSFAHMTDDGEGIAMINEDTAADNSYYTTCGIVCATQVVGTYIEGFYAQHYQSAEHFDEAVGIPDVEINIEPIIAEQASTKPETKQVQLQPRAATLAQTMVDNITARITPTHEYLQEVGKPVTVGPYCRFYHPKLNVQFVIFLAPDAVYVIFENSEYNMLFQASEITSGNDMSHVIQYISKTLNTIYGEKATVAVVGNTSTSPTHGVVPADSF